MKLQTKVLSLLTLAACFALLQPISILRAQEAAKPDAKHCFWKVETKTGSLHVLGSIHFLKKEFYPLDKVIEDTLAKSSVVVFEADPGEADNMDQEKKMKFAALGAYTGGETLQDNISDATYKKLDNYLKESGLPVQLISSLKPWMVSLTISVLELQKLGLNPEQGVDRYIYKKAKKDGKKVVPLETFEYQMGLFNGLSKEDAENMLKQTLDESIKLKSLMNEMTDGWRNGDLKKLNGLVEELAKYPEIYKILLVARNQAWLDKIEKLTAEGKDVLVVVGTAHLIGKDSLLEMLKKKGFPSKQL